MRSDHRFHKGKGWGGLSYEAMVADDGTIGFGNPMWRKSAAVASNNTGMVSICCPGTTGDRMTAAQKKSVRWLMDNWHTDRRPGGAPPAGPGSLDRLEGASLLPGPVHRVPRRDGQDYQEIW